MYADDFNEWEDEDWKTAHKHFVAALRKTLRSQGCYILSNKYGINRNMRESAQDSDLTWPQNDIIQ